jgi:hypothetical protein
LIRRVFDSGQIVAGLVARLLRESF